MYADEITDSMRIAIDETRRRRSIQEAYNAEHGIEPQTVRKAMSDITSFIQEAAATVDKRERSRGDELGHGEFYSPATADSVADELSDLSPAEVAQIMAAMEEEMAAASQDMDFERAAALRDQLVALKSRVEGTSADDVIAKLKQGARKGSAHATRRRYKRR